MKQRGHHATDDSTWLGAITSVITTMTVIIGLLYGALEIKRHSIEISGDDYADLAKIYHGCPQVRGMIDEAKRDPWIDEAQATQIARAYDHYHRLYISTQDLNDGRQALGMKGRQKSGFCYASTYDTFFKGDRADDYVLFEYGFIPSI